MVFQVHPGGWSADLFDQFKLITEFLLAQGCEFVRPYDYCRSLSLNATTNLSAINSSSNIQISWSDNSTTEINFKIERSIDGINYTNVGTSLPNSTSFTDLNATSLGNYYYRVYANCGIKSDYSNVVQINHTINSVKSTRQRT